MLYMAYSKSPERCDETTDFCCRLTTRAGGVSESRAVASWLCSLAGADGQQAHRRQAAEEYRSRSAGGGFRSSWRHLPHGLYRETRKGGVCAARVSEEIEARHSHPEERDGPCKTAARTRH